MKILLQLCLLLSAVVANSQSLPIDFEGDITNSNFIDFDGGIAAVIDNPQNNGINTSEKVAQIIRNGGQVWAGSKIEMASNLEFETMNSISMKVFSTAPIGTTIKFKLEGDGSDERDIQTTVTNEWETLTWDFTGVASNYNQLVFMFDFGNVGDGSTTSTFLFDDIEQLFSGFQIDLPVDFEGTTVNYAMTDFGGNASSFEIDPTDENNHVIKVIKTDQAATWAGTTIGTPAGFKTNIPLLLSDAKMTVKVWSPEAGTPIRLKVEDSKDPTHTCETETNTTVSGEWETLEFDFNNQAPGTESLSVGLSMGWTFNMASIFFNFGTEGVSAGEKTYYFDNVKFGDLSLSNDDLSMIQDVNAYPNPTMNRWTIVSDGSDIRRIDLFDVNGKFLLTYKPQNDRVDIEAEELWKGVYFAKVLTPLGSQVIRLIKN